MEGVLLRSKAKWIAKGGKITTYLLSLKKRNYVTKQKITLIIKKDLEIKESAEINDEGVIICIPKGDNVEHIYY